MKTKSHTPRIPKPTSALKTNQLPRPLTVPPWARFLSLAEFQHFIATVEATLRERHLMFDDGDGLLRVYLPNQIMRCGLANVALRCATVPPPQYVQVVREHFERVFGPPPELPPEVTSFAEVRDVVKVRLYTDEMLSRSPLPLVRRRLADDLNAVVVYDMGTMMTTMPPADLAHFNVSEDQVFAVATENIHHPSLRRTPFPEEYGIAGFSLYSDGPFLHGQLFFLQEHLPVDCPYGALVTLPHRHLLLCYPIRQQTVVSGVMGLLHVGDGMYNNLKEQHPEGAMSPKLYWWRPQKLLHLPGSYDRRSGGTYFAPPAEFQAVPHDEAIVVAKGRN